MKKRMVICLLCIALMTSCGKQERATVQNEQPKSPAVPKAAKVYATAHEADLKGAVRTRLDTPNPTTAQLARRERNNKIIREMGLPVLETLPVIEDEKVAK